MYQRVPPEIVPRPDLSDDLLTADEVAALLRMTSAWVYSETRGNRIPHLRLGRYVRYRRSTIVSWMGELEAESESGPGAASRGRSGRRDRRLS